MWFFRSIKGLLALQAIVLGLLVLASCSGIVQFRYRRYVDNDPLINPIAVDSHTDDTITLKDGRVLILQEDEYDWPESPLSELDMERIDIEAFPKEPGAYVVYVKRQAWYCGTGWYGMINIPIVPHDVPGYWRMPVGTVKFADTEIDLTDHRAMRLIRNTKGLFALQAIVLGLLVLATQLGVVDFHYDRFVHNDPLRHPVKVSSYDATSITLADGRTLLYDGVWIDLHPGVVNPPIKFIDIEPGKDNKTVRVFISTPFERCCYGQPGVITIPVIPRDNNQNYRAPAGSPVLVSQCERGV